MRERARVTPRRVVGQMCCTPAMRHGRCGPTIDIGQSLDTDLHPIANVPANTVLLRPCASILSTLHQWRSASLGLFGETSIVRPGTLAAGGAGSRTTITRPATVGSDRSIR